MGQFDDFFKDKPADAGGQSTGGATGIFGTVDEPSAAPAPLPPAAEAAKPLLPSVHEVKFHAPGSGDPGDTDPLHRHFEVDAGILFRASASAFRGCAGGSDSRSCFSPWEHRARHRRLQNR